MASQKPHRYANGGNDRSWHFARSGLGKLDISIQNISDLPQRPAGTFRGNLSLR
jgi:hypothetical protein